MGSPAGRYHASESAITGIFILLLGVGLTLGFGALFVGAVRDLRAFPDAPRPITVAEAAALAEPGPGAWVRVVDGRIDCRYPPHGTLTGSGAYAFLTDATGDAGGPRLLVALRAAPEGACSETHGAPFTGVLAASTPGRIVDLDWEGVDWNAWPTRHLTVLWTEAGPSDSRTGLWLGPLLTILGLGISLIGVNGIRDARRARRAPAPTLAGAAFVMPLSTGASAMAVFGGALVAIQLVVFGPLFFLKHLPGWMAIPLGILVAVWFFAVLGGLIDGWKRRASDLLLGRDELAVRGGPLHRTRLAFRDLDPELFSLRQAATEEDGDRATLVFDGEIAAVCRDQDEERSLAAVVETVRALAAQARGEHRPRSAARPPGVVTCHGCGAPVAPRDADQVVCGHCGATVTLPAEARRQLAALALLGGARAESERLLRRLLRQPGAFRTNLLLLVAIPPLLLGWPLAGALYDEMRNARHVFSWHHGVSLFVAALSFTYGLSWLLRAQVAGRAAVRLVATRFAAVAPEAPGEPASCRCCGGPLPEGPAEALVVLCVYCRSENVLGTNLVPAAAREADQAGDLGAELTARLAERRRYRLVSLASLVLLGVSLASLAPVWRSLRGG